MAEAATKAGEAEIGGGDMRVEHPVEKHGLR